MRNYKDCLAGCHHNCEYCEMVRDTSTWFQWDWDGIVSVDLHICFKSSNQIGNQMVRYHNCRLSHDRYKIA